MSRNEFAREMAVIHWRSELAAAQDRFDRLDSLRLRGQGAMPDDQWMKLQGYHNSTRLKLDDVRIDAGRAERARDTGGFVAHPHGGIADIDLFLEALEQRPG